MSDGGVFWTDSGFGVKKGAIVSNPFGIGGCCILTLRKHSRIQPTIEGQKVGGPIIQKLDFVRHFRVKRQRLGSKVSQRGVPGIGASYVKRILTTCGGMF